MSITGQLMPSDGGFASQGPMEMDSEGYGSASGEPVEEEDVKPAPMEDVVKQENGKPLLDKQQALRVLKMLKKSNLAATEAVFRKEMGIGDDVGDTELDDVDGSDELSTFWSVYKTETDPTDYESTYIEFKKFLGNALDLYKHELNALLYPVFVHMYLELIYNAHYAKAESFMKRFGPVQEYFYRHDIQNLAMIKRREHMRNNSFMDALKNTPFSVRLSRDSYSVLRRFLDDKRAKVGVLVNIVQEHVYLDVYEGIPRSKKEQVELTLGAMGGEAMQQANKGKIYYGLPKEPDVHVSIEDPAEGGQTTDANTASQNNSANAANEEEASKPKKKKSKKEIFSKKSKNDPNAPPATRLPLPDPRDIDKREKHKCVREAMKRITLGPDAMPSICFYTMVNTNVCRASCMRVSEDTSLLAVGFSDARVKIYSLVPTKLRGMKKAEDLNSVDKGAEDVYARMLDESTAEQQKVLIGHSGPVYCCSFSPDRTMLLSCSEDGNIRLWSLLTWTCLVLYKGHIFPVWEVKFSPHGFYFASCGHDRSVRLWTTDHNQPRRLFTGHLADVDCVEFHPNSNYLSSGSSDRSVRVWDCVAGNCVRVLTGHKAAVTALAHSNDGRYLTSGDRGGALLIWDLSRAYLLVKLNGHLASIHNMVFSRDGHMLASASQDCTLKLWDYAKLAKEFAAESAGPGAATPDATPHNPDVRTGEEEALLLGCYPTKKTPILELHFTRRNLLIGAGAFDGALVASDAKK